MLIEALADRWGAHETDRGKTVWFELVTPAAAAAGTGSGHAVGSAEGKPTPSPVRPPRQQDHPGAPSSGSHALAGAGARW